MEKKKVSENVFIGLLLIISLFYLINAFSYKFGSVSSPNSGFVPVVMGILSVVTCLFLLLVNRFKRNINEESPSGQPLTKPEILKILTVVLISIVFLLTFETIGFIMTVPFVLLIAKAFGYRGWIAPILFSVVVTLVIFLLFDYLLNIQLPAGLLETLM